MQFDERQIHAIVRRLMDERAAHDARLGVRRLLMEMAAEATSPGNGTGTNVPPPYDKSSMIIRVLIGEVPRAVQQYAAIVSANEPRFVVPPLAVDRSDVTQAVDRHAAEQERLLATLWDNASGRQKQRIVSRSQAWGRVGWYFTLPRDRAWGMPERSYYDDLPADEAEALKAAGKLTPEPLARKDGTVAYAESGSAYLDRRKRTAQERAINARSLFTLDTYGPDVVYAAYDSDGVKYAAAVLEVPSLDCGPGTDYAKLHARLSGADRLPDYDPTTYGLYLGSDGQIVGGVTRGGEQAGAKTWTYTIFATREEVYCLVGRSRQSVGTLVYAAPHDLGDCPFVPVPGFYTDSTRPGGEYSSPMEAVFAKAPIINQIETLLTNVAAWNALGRFVVVLPNGQLQEDPTTGDPVVLTQEKMLGANPGEVEVIGGQPQQLVVNADLLLKLLEFYAAQMKDDLPSAAAVGQEGTSGTAWGLRQMIEQQLANLQEPVDNHAQAVRKVVSMWIHGLRSAAEAGELETVYAFSLPRKRRDKGPQRGLIEFDPANLVDYVKVIQSSSTAQSLIVKQQAGIEVMQAGLANRRMVLEDYFEDDDARATDIEITASELEQFALYGDTSKIQPGSVLYDFAQALRGRISQKLLAMIPAYAIQSARQMATDAQSQFMQTQAQQQAGQGNVAAAAGIVQPGVNGPLEQPGTPGGGSIPDLAPVPAGGA